MPTLNAQQLLEVGVSILTARGVPAAAAERVAQELADSNMVGHDSHGIMRLVQYVQLIDQEHIHPQATPEVILDQQALLKIDGHFHFGQVVAWQLYEGLKAKAKQFGTATGFVCNCNHVGRLGSYTEKAASEGFVALMAVNAPGPGQVAPFGTMERRMGTNPISIGAPGEEAPLVLDMTTSATAEGKLRVAHQKGDSVPEGLMIDGHGNPTTNPGDYYSKPYGAILPLGGDLGHKGFGLSVMVDLLCGILSGSGVGRTDLPRGANGVWMTLIDANTVLPGADYQQWISSYAQHLKSAKLRPGFNEVLFPGEMERRQHQARTENGVSIPEETWRQLTELAETVGAQLPAV